MSNAMFVSIFFYEDNLAFCDRSVVNIFKEILRISNSFEFSQITNEEKKDYKINVTGLQCCPQLKMKIQNMTQHTNSMLYCSVATIQIQFFSLTKENNSKLIKPKCLSNYI